MRTTRLAAAGVAALVALSGTFAAADTTGEQTVTIAVTAAPRTITTAGSVAISMPIATEGGVELDPATVTTEGSPTIAYTNPAGNGAARISAALLQIDGDAITSPTPNVNGWDLLGIEVAVNLAAAAALGDETVPTPSGDTNRAFEVFQIGGTPTLRTNTGALLTGIPDGVDRAATAIVYAISGQQPLSAASNALTIAFTIEDD